VPRMWRERKEVSAVLFIFPKFLFGKQLAEAAPKAYLCKTHHMDEWHKKLTPNMSIKDLD